MNKTSWPKRSVIYKASGVALWDVASTTLNYTGAALSGPTIFAIIYSSVTIWTAFFSHIFLSRIMNFWQWANVIIVFIGLAITASDSTNMGHDVVKGSIFIFIGSTMHGLTYVMSESVMLGTGEQRVSVLQNTFVQTSVAAALFIIWQLVYTLPHFNELIWYPMQEIKTTIWYACFLFFAFGMANVIHSITFFHTLLHFPGGATSAGVMKGLQAVLVFVLTNFLYCNKVGGTEMCFSDAKFVSLFTVTGGVLGYGYATQLTTLTTKKDVVDVDDGKGKIATISEITGLL